MGLSVIEKDAVRQDKRKSVICALCAQIRDFLKAKMCFRRHDVNMTTNRQTAATAARQGRASGAQSVDRALELLSLVAAHHGGGIKIPALVEQTGLDRTTVHRLVKALERHQLLHREARTEGYRLGLEAYALGQASMPRPPLVRQYTGLMKSLARRVDEPLFLVARAGDYSHCLHMEGGSRPVKTFNETVGGIRLLGLGVPSFAMLAHMDDCEVLAHYGRFQEEYLKNRMTLARLRKWVDEARQQGFSHILGKGVRGVGVRFAFGVSGEAALGFVAPSSRLSRNAAIDIGRWLVREVAALQKQAALSQKA